MAAPMLFKCSRFNLRLLVLKSFRCFQSRHNSSELLYKLLRRGLIKEIFPADHEIACQGVPCAYGGFDATADSLHIGNLLVLISLLHWQRAGYRTLVVIGDTTAQVGDPSGHKTDRNILSDDIISNNAISVEQNVVQIFENHKKYIIPKKKSNCKLGELRILKNSSWYKDLSITDFFCGVGRHIRVGEMLSRTSVKSRMESGAGINFAEFSYQAFQSYDWLHLFKNYNCRFQIGGSDQMGNILSGYNLISGCQYQHVYGCLLPLIQSESGDKFGKSAGNAVYISQQRTSFFDFYQFFLRLPDAGIDKYLKLFTFLSLNEIEDIIQNHMKNPDARRAQRILAEEVTLLVHGEQGLALAETATKVLYQSDLASLTKLNIEELKLIFPSSTVSYIPYEPGISILDLSMKVGCFMSEGDAKRIISGGGLYINFTKISSPSAVIVPDIHILPNKTSLLRVGKRNYYVVLWK